VAGSASITSLANSTPRQSCSGGRSSHATRALSSAGRFACRRSRWRSRRSALGSRIKYRRGKVSPAASVFNVASANAPLPPPSSRKSASPPSIASTGCNAFTTQRANSSPSSGAVTKSPAAPNLVRPAL